MKKLFSYMICVVGLVLVMCGSASALDVSGYEVRCFSSTTGNFSSYSPTSSGAFCYFTNDGNTNFGLRITVPASSSVQFFSFAGLFPCYGSYTSSGWGKISSYTYDYFSVTFSASSSFFMKSAMGSIPQPYSPSYSSIMIPAHSNPLYIYIYSCFSMNAAGKGFGGYIANNATISLSPVPTSNTQQSTLLSIEQLLQNMASGAQQSPMDKFESDYIQNFDNQLTKTEEYIGSDSPVIPGNFVTSGSDGSPSMVDSLKDGMGLSNSSFDSQAFQDASQAFSGPDSTSEGGMWWFFTQEIADALEATNSNSREEDTVDAWISDSDRRWSIWGW